jgi:hypothetical protein
MEETEAMIIPEPKFSTIRNSPRVRLLEDWLIESEYGLMLIVPRGFETDLASVPRWLWPILSPFGDLRYGGIIHDFGYQHAYLLSPYSGDQAYNLESIALREKYPALFGGCIPVFIGKKRDFFDQLLRYVTIQATGEKLKAESAYLALKAFGWIAWNKYRKLGPAAYNANSLGLPTISKDEIPSRTNDESLKQFDAVLADLERATEDRERLA